MNFQAALHPVANRGVPPISFLEQLVTWGRFALEEIFAPNPNPRDIYALVLPQLGPWEGPLHRRAVMLEVMRVHAGFESAWNWREGVDVTNACSLTHPEGEETGAWQVSFDSTRLNRGALAEFTTDHGIETPAKFIAAMKTDHRLAMDYYARLVRVSVAWAGPLINRHINRELRREAVAEFQALLAV